MPVPPLPKLKVQQLPQLGGKSLTQVKKILETHGWDFGYWGGFGKFANVEIWVNAADPSIVRIDKTGNIVSPHILINEPNAVGLFPHVHKESHDVFDARIDIPAIKFDDYGSPSTKIADVHIRIKSYWFDKYESAWLNYNRTGDISIIENLYFLDLINRIIDDEEINMFVVLMKCEKCGNSKEFWLKDPREEGFWCKCGYARKPMRNYHNSVFLEYFEMELAGAATIDDVIKNAKGEHLYFDELAVREKIKEFPFPNLSWQDGCDITSIISHNINQDEFRKKLSQEIDLEELLTAIARLNPRIDLPGLRNYLGKIKLPLSERDVLAMEKMIEQNFYNPEIYTVTDW